MEIGTADIVEEIVEPGKRRTSGIGGSNKPGNGKGRGPNGPGGDRPDDGDAEDRFAPEKSRIFTGFLLLVVVMTFGGLIAAYVVIATNNVAEWHPFDLPIQVWLSTVIIIASSITYHFGKLATERNDQPSAKRRFIATTVLGAAFISSQILAWIELTRRGLYISGNPYAGFFYILTAVHAVHVIGGVAALGSILLRVWNPTSIEDELLRRRSVAQVVGWYWHVVGALWLVLFILLGFWK
ncbi:MAG: heme-copper oxidase subunit III [Chloracidobacterium sp.]|nr:heme-copper oxidase subunit III [Chloracidobacterium sp.]